MFPYKKKIKGDHYITTRWFKSTPPLPTAFVSLSVGNNRERPETFVLNFYIYVIKNTKFYIV